MLQLGIGRALAGVSDALVGKGLALSVHSGLVSDWTRRLVDEGVACRPLPCAKRAPLAAAAAMGSAGFYRWLDRRSSVRLDEGHLAGLGGFVAVNSASRVDMSGQVGVPGEVASQRGVGGLLDFAVAGACGGKSIIALESLDRSGRSRIVPTLTAVVLPSPLVTHVVTEYGVAQLANRTWAQRVRQLVSIAHPQHRAELRRAIR